MRALAGLEPDLVVDTGDNLGHLEAVPAVLDALGPLLERPGAFVMGSNDYYAPMLKNPARYLLPAREVRLGKARLPTEDLRDGLLAAGWVDLDNARARLKVDHREIELVGTDDAHIRADRYAEVAGPGRPGGRPVARASPTRRTAGSWTRWSPTASAWSWPATPTAGSCGVPGVGALVTNCDLPRRQARGLSTWSSGGRAGLAARVRGPGHVAVRAGPVRLPARGHPADAGGETIRPGSARLAGLHRGVAQLGSALRSGRRGRGFKSRHPDTRRPVTCSGGRPSSSSAVARGPSQM